MRTYTLRGHHRRRHRKKLRLAEFAEYGFSVRARSAAPLPPHAVEPAIAFIESNGWCWDADAPPHSSQLHGFVRRFGGGSLTDVDRELLRSWMIDAGYAEIDVGPLEDAWRRGR